jgi:hypothetical protein
MNPIWGIAKTLVSELCPPKHEARGMGLTTGCWSLGLVFGPACGGLLASPAQLYPRYFTGTIFETFPYLLPNLVTAFFALLGAILLFLFFPETLTSDPLTSPPQGQNSSSSNPPPSSTETRGASIVELARYPGVANTLCAYLVISFSSICLDEVIPLWSMASHSHGGLELPQVMIGTMLTITGVVLTLYTLLVYPLIAQALGRNRSFRVSQLIFAILAGVTTLIHSLPPSSAARFPLLVTFYTASKACCSLGFASLALVLNHCVTKDKRGSLNGLSMTFGSIAKSFGPLFGAMAFAWSIARLRPFPLDYHLVFLAIAGSCLVSVAIPLPPENESSVEAKETTGGGGGDRGEEDEEATMEDCEEEHGLVEMRALSSGKSKPLREEDDQSVLDSLRGLVGMYLPSPSPQEYQSLTMLEEEERGAGRR